jgi:hypothetical protein
MFTALAGNSDASGWAQFESYLAAAKQSWWGSSAAGAWKDYLTYTTNVNAKYTAYQSAVDTAYLAKVSALASADMTYAASSAAADVYYAAESARAEQSYTAGSGNCPGMAVTTEKYLDAVAQAERDYAVNTAEGVSDAESQHTAALAAAKSIYLTADAAAEGKLQTDLATADLDYTKAFSSPQVQGQGGGADLVYASATATADYTYATAESTDYATLQNALVGKTGGVAGLAEAFALANAQSYHTAINALVTAHSSAWAIFAQSQAAAMETLVSTDTTALATDQYTVINAMNTEEGTDSLAEKTRITADAATSAMAALVQPNADYATAVAQAAADNQAASQGNYQAELPDGPGLPENDAQAVDAVLAADYGADAPMTARYNGYVGDIFGIPSVETSDPKRTADYAAQYYREKLQGNLISDELGRLMDPTQETVVANNVAKYFNTLGLRHYDKTTHVREFDAQYFAPGATAAPATGDVNKPVADEDTIYIDSGDEASDGLWDRSAGGALVNVKQDLQTGHGVSDAVLRPLGHLAWSYLDNMVFGGWGETVADVAMAGCIVAGSGGTIPLQGNSGLADLSVPGANLAGDDLGLGMGTPSLPLSGSFDFGNITPPLYDGLPSLSGPSSDLPSWDRVQGGLFSSDPSKESAPGDTHPIPSGHALSAADRYSNMAMGRPGFSYYANANIDPKRVELAIALADVASRAMADRQIAFDRIADLQGTLDRPSRTTNWSNVRGEIASQQALVDKLNKVIQAAINAWSAYQLDDVTVALGSTSFGSTLWSGKKGMDKLFAAENAGKFLPVDQTPNSFWLAVDAITWAIPAFRSVRVGGRAAGVAAESAARGVTVAERIAQAEAALKEARVAGAAAKEGWYLKILQDTCFVAGTPVLVPGGEKVIEDFKPGDEILSRPDDSPDMPPRTSVVEEVFQLTGETVELRVGGQTITTTAKRPFYISEKGWVPAQALQPGDLLVGHDGRTTAVQSITPTHRQETVYNLRVAIDHTYFVGRRAWGFTAWVHNIYEVGGEEGAYTVVDAATKRVVQEGIIDKVAADRIAAELNKGIESLAEKAVSGAIAPRVLGRAINAKTWQEYETAIRSIYGEASFSAREYTAIVDGNLVSSVADNVTEIAGKRVAIEAKFSENWATCPYNPESSLGKLPFAVKRQAEMVQQAKKYAAAFPGGTIYYSNSPELIAYYRRVFREAGIKNFTFVLQR